MPSLREFFAWSSTYFASLVTIDCGNQVVERRRVDKFLQPHPFDCHEGLPELLCLSLGELFYEWQSNKIQARPTVLSLRSTFGYVAACAMMPAIRVQVI